MEASVLRRYMEKEEDEDDGLVFESTVVPANQPIAFGEFELCCLQKIVCICRVRTQCLSWPCCVLDMFSTCLVEKV